MTKSLSQAAPKDGELNDPLIEFLIKSERLTQSAVDRARILAEQRPSETFSTILVNLGMVSNEALADAVSEFTGYPRSTLDEIEQALETKEPLSSAFLRFNQLVPVSRNSSDALTFAVINPLEIGVRKACEFISDPPPDYVVSTAAEIEATIDRLYVEDDEDTPGSNESDLSEDVQRLKELASDAPVVKFVNRLIDQALKLDASDIHLEATETGLRCRLRVDGVLKDARNAPPDLAAAITSRIKIMSGLDIAERRMPQDGRMRYRADGREIDFRVATSPSSAGESAVVRLLDRKNTSLDLNKLGYQNELGSAFSSALNLPDGIILVTGPTGSGKTTTLYAALSVLNTDDRKILTVEDPVEYTLPGVNQTQVEPRIGRTFATMLRSFLRQDPDVMMVGEIRDRETADIAIQSALTGHLVLSTLHTNDAAAAVTRLIDMGVEPFLIASTVRLLVAQRLVRRLCPKCKVRTSTKEYSPDIQKALQGIGCHETFEPVGCEDCGKTGYKGRALVAECLPIDAQLRLGIQSNSSAEELRASAIESGFVPMFGHGLELVKQGITSVAEVQRVTSD